MWKKIFIVWGLIFQLFSTCLLAKERDMEFELHYTDCRSRVDPVFILAKGKIVESTPQNFYKFLKKINFMPEIYFDSKGGDLIAGMELGKIIREKGFDTYISDEYEKLDCDTQKKVVLSKKAVCFSACSYAFIGGVGRKVSKTALLGVHQFFSSKNIGDSKTQYMLALLSAYINQMGVKRSMLDIASTTNNKEIQLIDNKLAIALNIDNTTPLFEGWKLDADKNGNIFICVETLIKSNHSIGVLCFFRDKKKIIGVLTYSIKQNFRSPKDLDDIFSSENKDADPYLDIKNKRYALKSGDWVKTNSNTYAIEFLVDDSIINELLESNTFEFIGNFANFARDVEPRIEFSLKNYRKSILALARHNR